LQQLSKGLWRQFESLAVAGLIYSFTMDNLVQKSIPANTLAEALKMVREARALLAAYLISLTPKERESMPKMGDKSLAFVTKTAEYAQSLPKLMPQYMDVPAFLVDAGVSSDLLELFLELTGFTLDVDSTRMEAGSEGYTAALMAYGALKSAAQSNQPGAQAAVTMLEPRFKAQGVRKPKVATA
jgi:hypothetical protein